MAFLHPGDLSGSQWLFLLVFWGGYFLAGGVAIVFLIKAIVKRVERRQRQAK